MRDRGMGDGLESEWEKREEGLENEEWEEEARKNEEWEEKVG